MLEMYPKMIERNVVKEEVKFEEIRDENEWTSVDQDYSNLPEEDIIQENIRLKQMFKKLQTQNKMVNSPSHSKPS